MNKSLKPCPFCGGGASGGVNARGKYQVICLKCLAASVPFPNEKLVIEAWNRRVGEGRGMEYE